MTENYSDLLAKIKSSVYENAEGELLEMISFFSERPFEELRRLRLEAKRNPNVWSSVLSADVLKKVSNAVKLRCSGVPVQYLTRRAFFFGREFYVDERTLIPRFDTEALVDAALPFISEKSRVLDLCCGSGCIGLTLCLEKNCYACFADVSEDALAVARKNAKILGVENADFLRHNVFSDSLTDCFDVIVCNPPYISVQEMENLDREVLHEPRIALEAGDGYSFYGIVPTKYSENLRNGGSLFFEVGKGQSDRVVALCESAGYDRTETFKDLNNIERVVRARKPLETVI